MNPLVSELPKHTKFNTLLKSIKDKEKDLSITGLNDAAKAHFIYSIYNYSEMRPVVVCPNVTSAKRLIQDLKFYSNKEIVYFPAREIVYYDIDVQSKEIDNARIYAINKIIKNEDIILVTTIDAILQPMLPKQNYEGTSFTIEKDKTLDINILSTKLVKLGYERETLVQSKGQFSIRGGIIDIFPINEEIPYRVELFGEEVDSIRSFDVESQRSTKSVDRIDINISSEYIISHEQIEKVISVLQDLTETKKLDADLKSQITKDIDSLNNNEINKCIDRYFDILVEDKMSILEYLEKDYTIYFDEPSKCISRAEAIKSENDESLKIVTQRMYVYPRYSYRPFSFNDIEIKLKSLSSVYISRLNDDRVLHAKRKEYSFSCREVNFFRSTMDLLIQDIKRFIEQKKIICTILPTDIRVESVKNALIDNNIKVKYIESLDMIKNLDSSLVYITKGIVSSGFYLEDFDLVVVSEPVSGTVKKQKKTSEQLLGDTINSYEDLKIGDFVVHVNHGIGKYLGVETVDTNGVVRDYIKLLYKDDGVLYIPITTMDSIKKYVCEEGFTPKLNKLGSTEWEKTRANVSKHVSDLAKDLILLYAKRLEAKGFAFSKDTPWQAEFESDFPYELTEDQRRCIDEMKKDMESIKSMDRLLCGDVGYGKTEVAIRGAFKAVMDGKQVAYLVPTTVLSMQQFNVFKERMEKFSVKVEMLSRFRTPKEQEDIVKRLESGEIDVIIGTHRILSNDVKFKDLGFLIIDEEHRFGVEHKEAIKKYKNNIDVLSMTATPIPRTLHMSMVGIRDVSIILDPPLERLPIHTYVLEYSPDVIAEAMEKELSRDGQVLYINNRVENIENIVSKVKSLAPDARVAYAHGKMTPNQIEDAMLDYTNHNIDILVCTTIVESGIDIPNANTIIIENADKLGLSQLYQIRGRVGRSNRLAYAYITYKKKAVLTEEAEKRLTAIKDYSEFGSGFKIALRDLEIRGAGNVLGAEQHGHMMSVGYDMYASMLKKAIDKEKQNINEEVEKHVSIDDVKIVLDVSANIPDDYIENKDIKIAIYQKLSNAENEEQINDTIDEMVDRFGDIPAQTKNLIEIVKIRNIARSLNIDEIKTSGEFLWLSSKYVKNHIKYRLTNTDKHDILTLVKEKLLDLKSNF